MKNISAKTALVLLFSLSGCYVAPAPAPVYAPPPPAAYYGAPAYYAAPAPAYYAPYTSFGLGVGYGGGWHYHH